MSEKRLARMLTGRGSRTLVLPYLTAGYPSAGETVELLLALETGRRRRHRAGASLQRSPGGRTRDSGRVPTGALDAGIDHVRKISPSAARSSAVGFRGAPGVDGVPEPHPGLTVPRRFFTDAVSAGVDAIIVPDLPPGGGGCRTTREAGEKAGLSWIFLAAPTSSRDERLETDRLPVYGDMSYCVAVTGVTGARDVNSLADLSRIT